jgi:hypothetical protein
MIKLRRNTVRKHLVNKNAYFQAEIISKFSGISPFVNGRVLENVVTPDFCVKYIIRNSAVQ